MRVCDVWLVIGVFNGVRGTERVVYSTPNSGSLK